MTPENQRDLVLVGGGHAHVQVLERLAGARLPRTRVTLVVDTPVAVYSGMVPGFVAGQYRADELEIDVVPLARRAGARVVMAPMVGLDPGRRTIEVAGRPPIPFDVASLDIGSSVLGLDLPGVRERALSTRPIGTFVERMGEELTGASSLLEGRVRRVVVVGGGAGGVELAFALEGRLRSAGLAPRVTLVNAGQQILPGSPAGLRARVLHQAAARRIGIRAGAKVVAVEEGSLRLEDGTREPFDILTWATGAVASRALSRVDLPKGPRGFLRTRATLEVEDCAGLFAAGDCAHLADFPDTPKAGVYAVRQGPVLARNLEAALAGRPLQTFRPQGDFLTLLNLGDGTAAGSKWGASFEGRWVLRLKDAIDRRFVRRFQVLDASGGPAETFRSGVAMGTEVPCGGCAAKLGQTALDRVLARLAPPLEDESVVLGLSAPDDAVATVTPARDVVVSSLDAFPAFSGDPFVVGQVAAVSAISDLLAKGVEPRHAQALVALPEGQPSESLEQTLVEVLAGARAAFDPVGVGLLGGHTLLASGLLVGFVVDGVAPRDEPLLRMGGLRVGDHLILTKPLGTGVLLRADMRAQARGRWVQAALASMTRPNQAAAVVARGACATASTDVTGFGLAGHLAAMLRASGASAVLDVAALPALPGALELLGRGVGSTSHAENERLRRFMVVSGEARAHPRLALLFDPQTSGGLLFGVPGDRAQVALDRLRVQGDQAAAAIGRIERARADGILIDVRLGQD